YGLGEALGDLEGTVIASGAQDIDTGAGALIRMKGGACGAEAVINTENQVGARCHRCRHILPLAPQVRHGGAPDAVLPIGIPKQHPIGRLREFVAKRNLSAVRLFKQAFTPENAVGVYLPYMSVDGSVSAEVRGVGEIETRRYTRGTGDSKKTYYDADVYQVRRSVDFTVDDLTIESSAERANFDTRVNTNNIINAILPFDTKNAVKWNA